ncbi:ras-related protein Rab-14 isoform 1-T2 [Sarcophilus harrisii]
MTSPQCCPNSTTKLMSIPTEHISCVSDCSSRTARHTARPPRKQRPKPPLAEVVVGRLPMRKKLPGWREARVLAGPALEEESDGANEPARRAHTKGRQSRSRSGTSGRRRAGRGEGRRREAWRECCRHGCASVAPLTGSPAGCARISPFFCGPAHCEGDRKPCVGCAAILDESEEDPFLREAAGAAAGAAAAPRLLFLPRPPQPVRARILRRPGHRPVTVASLPWCPGASSSPLDASRPVRKAAQPPATPQGTWE